MIQPAFHVSLLKKALYFTQSPSILPPHLIADFELPLQLVVVLGKRSNIHDSPTFDVLIQWKDMSTEYATWEATEIITQQFSTFHLKGEAKLFCGDNDRDYVSTHYRKRKYKKI